MRFYVGRCVGTDHHCTDALSLSLSLYESAGFWQGVCTIMSTSPAQSTLAKPSQKIHYSSNGTLLENQNPKQNQNQDYLLASPKTTFLSPSTASSWKRWNIQKAATALSLNVFRVNLGMNQQVLGFGNSSQIGFFFALACSRKVQSRKSVFSCSRTSIDETLLAL